MRSLLEQQLLRHLRLSMEDKEGTSSVNTFSEVPTSTESNANPIGDEVSRLKQLIIGAIIVTALAIAGIVANICINNSLNVRVDDLYKEESKMKDDYILLLKEQNNQLSDTNKNNSEKLEQYQRNFDYIKTKEPWLKELK